MTEHILSWDEQLEVLKSAIALLEDAINTFDNQLGSPSFIDEPGKERFEYQNPTSLHFQFLKSIRVVSGLNAIECLLKGGFEQEIGVIIRTLYDFIDDIDCVQEVHNTGKLSSIHKNIVNDFFKSTLKTPEELMEEPDKVSRVVKKKKRASIVRSLQNWCNPDRLQKLHSALSTTYSGYVHGNYPHIMTLCEGHVNPYGHLSTRFLLKGILDTPQIDACRGMFAGLVHRSLNELGLLALNFGLSNIKEGLIEKRKEIESKGIYDPRPTKKDIER